MTDPTRLLENCIICGRPLDEYEPQTCYRCYHQVRALIGDIVALYAELPDVIGHLTGLRSSAMPSEKHPTPGMPGGDALVMMGPGSEGRADNSRTVRDGDPHSVSGILGAWEDAWRAERRETGAPQLATVKTAAAYLLGHVQWASNTSPGFKDFARDLQHLKGRMRVVTGQISPPVRSDARCLGDDCDGRLEQHWTDAGLSPDRTCPTCQQVYAPAQYRMALKAHLLDENRDPLMTAGMIVSVSQKRFGQHISYMQLARWVKRGVLEPAGTATKGKRAMPTYRVTDVLNLIIDPDDTTTQKAS